MSTIVAVRHGETPWNLEGRMQGWAPVPLNERGREQADAAGRHLAERYEFDAVHASDLLRTKETVEAFLDHLPFDADRVSYESAWRERDIGVYQGLTYDDVFERFPEFALGEAAVDAAERTPESGESFVTVHDRVTARFDEVLDEMGPDETRLVVTHGGPIYMLLSHVRGRSIRETMLSHSQANCAVNEFHRDREAGETRVVCRNDVDWDE